MMDLRERLAYEIDKIHIISTHEHTQRAEFRRSMNPDFTIFMIPYVSSDLISAGMDAEMSRKVFLDTISIHEKWRILKPYWERARNTAYSRQYLDILKDIYDTDDLNDDTYEILTNRIREFSKDPGLYRKIYKEMAKIDLCILSESLTDVDKEFFRAIYVTDDLTLLYNKESVQTVERLSRVSINNLDNYTKAVLSKLENEIKNNGIVGLKLAVAYQRDLSFDEVERSAAEKILFEYLNLREEWWGAQNEVPLDYAKPLQDYIYHRIFEFAQEMNVPICIHTGLQGTNGNYITNSNPTRLVNLFLKYPGVKFNLFHGSYPYMGELGTLAKNFPNVYIDTCWLYQISPTASKKYLREWLEIVPATKIFGMGSDTSTPEPAYAYAKWGRKLITNVFTYMVNDKYLSEEAAVITANKILRQNAIDFFNLVGFEY